MCALQITQFEAHLCEFVALVGPARKGSSDIQPYTTVLPVGRPTDIFGNISDIHDLESSKWQ